MSCSVEQQRPNPEDAQNQAKKLDLVGGPFAVIESDPGVFTTLTRKLGVKGVELLELYDIEPWAVDHLNPHGLIFCFLWRKDHHRPGDFDDPAADRVWFANQLSDDACATHALLNILLNCPALDIGEELRSFKSETAEMSPEMKGLAITNSHLIRSSHNSLSRPADLRGATNALATATIDQAEVKVKNAELKVAKEKETSAVTRSRGTRPPPKKRPRRGKRSGSSSPEPSTDSEQEERRATAKKRAEQKDKKVEAEKQEVYHFIGYVPAYGKVWELDGLKSGPLEVGELSPTDYTAANGSATDDAQSTKGWMDVVRPALRMKMDKYGGSADGDGNIKFSLLAVVDGLYETASDDLQLLLRKKEKLESRMPEGWHNNVDQNLLTSVRNIAEKMSTSRVFAPDFGSAKMDQDLDILEMPETELLPTWVSCASDIVRASIAVEDELTKAMRANTDHIRRTWDYEPFLRGFIEKLNKHGLLRPLLGLDEDGKKIPKGRAVTKMKR